MQQCYVQRCGSVGADQKPKDILFGKSPEMSRKTWTVAGAGANTTFLSAPS
jgi:hypothetical protein